MAPSDQPLATLHANRERWVRELATLVGIPSVSTDPQRYADVQRAARWLRARLEALGMPTAELVETGGNPIVWARCQATRGRRTIVMYGHYDVVSPGPSERWRSPPFGAVQRGHFLYGRGTSDDKGPLVCQLAALDAWLSSAQLPVTVVCVYDGEEEIGSPGLRRLLASGLASALGLGRADAVLVCDTRMLAPGRPALITGLRGSLGAEVEVRGAPRELHSGAFGGVIRNPAHALSELLASMHDQTGRVTIDGFYRDVRAAVQPPIGGNAERLITDQITGEAGAAALFGEAGWTTYERGTVRPALDVNGLIAGHGGPGIRGIIPARATAKLSFRLVPDQDPARIAGGLKRHVDRYTPAGMTVRTKFSKPSRPVTIDTSLPALAAARAALTAGFGRPPATLQSGGTIAVVEALAAHVGPPVLMGFARADDGMHGPNERVDLNALAAGARSIVHLLELMGRR